MIKNQLHITALVLFALIAAALLFNQVTAKSYRISNANLAELSSKPELFISYAELKSLLEKGSLDAFQVVDLRPAGEFVQAHLPSAFNIPFEAWDATREASKKIRPKSPVLLYAGEEYQAVAAQMMLLSQGFRSVRAIPGSYDHISRHVLEAWDPSYGHFREDKARFNYPWFFRGQPSPAEGESLAPQIPQAAPPRQPVAGGC